jgi:hypothetical protein
MAKLSVQHTDADAATLAALVIGASLVLVLLHRLG